MVIGIIGGLALVAGLVVVFAYEASTTPEATLVYPVTWSVQEAGASERTAELEEDEAAAFQFNVSARNLTTVRILLAWEDDVGQPDRFNLTVVDPFTGQTRTRSATNGSIPLVYTLSSVPDVGNLSAPDRGRAQERLNQDHARQAGTGSWQVTVRLEDAPGQRPVPAAEELETQPDGANSFSLSIRYNAYAAQVGAPRAPGR